MRHLSVCLFALVVIAGLLPGELIAAESPYQEWKHSGSLWLLTTPDGADLPAGVSVEGFPVLVRLHKDWFDFSQANPAGEDLRFSTPAGEPLTYQIEHWDTAAGVAAVWVRVPKIAGNARQELKLHWGHENAKSESSGLAVFHTSNGYFSVWHMGQRVSDSVGSLPSTDNGTTAIPGMIGLARHFPGGKGIFSGDKLENLPTGASSHSTEAWFRSERPNTTLIGWGNEGGGRGSKIRMQFRSPPHIKIDSDFSDVKSESRLPLNEWVHVVHTYNREDGRLYINGKLDGAAKPLLNIKSPARLWLGGWYHNYDFVGDLDEVRISQVARSADWIRLQYENQKPNQTLVGLLVQPGDEFAVTAKEVRLAEGQTTNFTVRAGGAQQVSWVLKRGEQEQILATNQLRLPYQARRVVGNQAETLQVRAVYPTGVKTQEIAISIADEIPEAIFKLVAPATWDGRQTLEIIPQVENAVALKKHKAAELNYAWNVDGIAVIQQAVPGKLILKRAQGSGPLRVSVAVDNGGEQIVQHATIQVTEPASKDEFVVRPIGENEQPVDNQFFARDGREPNGARYGQLVYVGTLPEEAESVYLRVFADDKLFAEQTSKLTADKKYSLAVKLKAGLVKYRTEFGSLSGNQEKILHVASNLVCGDALLIDGQSNAEATDIGKDDPTFTSDWIRSFGSPSGDPNNARLETWGNAVARDRRGGKHQIGYWGMELARQLVEKEQIPICILNGAVGGTRIDTHQRNPADPTDVKTIYGRLLWRVQRAKLTHGIRAVLWHQGENDQGADGPTGGFGWETYRQYFVDMSAAWKEDYPNIEQYYVFQIWPKACAMGINGSDNRLREVQRTLPNLYSNLHVMSTLGIQPPGGCHFPPEGYAQFAALISPLIEQHLYKRKFAESITPANLRRAYFTADDQKELTLEFDQPVVWTDNLASQFYLDGDAKQVVSGSVNGNRLTLKLNAKSNAKTVTYLDSKNWSQQNLLKGPNGLAALTFCDVPIEPR
ncbi:DUF2341 domain-containing protein [Anatilimnocola sp. NA78]|uniref:DUF2341 domain-containing protein n=1 Tax=Anatilimnocola sp. NA78 TaxID=3415683 RepID=UPI003CE4D07F